MRGPKATEAARAAPSRRAGAVGLFGSLAALAVLLSALVAGQASVRNAMGAAEHSAEERLAVRTMLTTLIDAETGQRGYLLTGDPKFLEPYHRAQGALPAAMAALRRLAAGGAHRRHLDEIERLGRGRLDLAAESVRLYEAGAVETALGVVRSGRGKAVMDRLREVIATMEAEEARELAARQARARAVGEAMMALSLVSTGALGATLVSVVAMRRDAERRRRADEERAALLVRLRGSEARLRRLFDAGLMGVVYWDGGGRVLEANDAFLAMVGYDRDDLAAGRIDWGALTPPEYRAADEAALAAVRARGAGPTYEKEYLRKGGGRVPVLVGAARLEGSADEGVAFVLDVTERRRAVDALARAARHIETLHAIDRAILRAESPRQIASAAAGRLAEAAGARYVSVVCYDEGLRRGTVLAIAGDVEVPGRAGDEIEPPAWFLERVASAAGPVTFDLRAPGAEHPFKDALLAAGLGAVMTAPLASDGELLGVLNLALPSPAEADEARGVVAEVAAQVAVALKQGRLREALRRHADELERRVETRTAALTEANRELEAFSYSVSHDLRAPLRGMQGYALALVEDFGAQLGEVGLGYTQKIVAAAGRMEGLIQDLLSYGRLGREHVALQPTSLRSAVDEALQQAAADAAAAGAAIEVGDVGLEVVAHRPTLVLCVQNYLTNALKFVAPGRAPRVRVGAEAVGDAGRLWVEDEGLGVLPEHRERIFHVFERLHSADKYPGTGIGLAIVKRGVERMGGRAGVEPAPGGGSRFWLELPLVKGPTP